GLDERLLLGQLAELLGLDLGGRLGLARAALHLGLRARSARVRQEHQRQRHRGDARRARCICAPHGVGSRLTVADAQPTPLRSSRITTKSRALSGSYFFFTSGSQSFFPAASSVVNPSRKEVRGRLVTPVSTNQDSVRCS